ncbi:hypothetical protein ACFSHQ_16790 [Gemmobacter lanyuensis]
MQQEPTFLMCVGATKAGTSWLFDRLSAHEDCHLRTIKELHYFDMLYRGNFDRYVEGFTRRAQGIEAELPALSGGRLRKFQRRLQDVTDWLAVVLKRGEDLAAYRAYLTQGLRGRRLVADVTPVTRCCPKTAFAAWQRWGRIPAFFTCCATRWPGSGAMRAWWPSAAAARIMPPIACRSWTRC